ncbi:hypothetical protein ASE49_10920 [Novosphingobium sp. Leaf2]|nr:hypothetical protein ASE49_10920 [Novosphingobium sp. Leaf2]
MKAVCSNQNLATAYAGYMLGYHVFDTGGGERIAIAKGNSLAEEIIDRAHIDDWTFVGWSGGNTEGRCTMRFALTMAPQDAAHFNNDPLWGGDVVANMSRDGGGWKVVSFVDSGAKAAVSGWITAWRDERDQQPAGTQPGSTQPLGSPVSPRELAMKIQYAKSCTSHWEISDDLFPAYNAWLDTLGTPALSKFKVGSSGHLENGRLVSSSNQAIVCRYNVGTGIAGGIVDRSIHDLDMRFTVLGNRPKWEVVTFPYASVRTFTAAQAEQLISQIYVDGEQLKAGREVGGDHGGTVSKSGQGSTTREAKQ